MSDSRNPNPRLFGTDGIRGVFGESPLDDQSVHRLGRRIGERLRNRQRGSEKPLVVLGGDTRASSPTLAAWIGEGLHEEGVDTIDLGVLPTPGVADLTRRLGADLGIVLSASHNLVPDNGIKLIGPDGFKLSRSEEADLEKAFGQPPGTTAGATTGTARDVDPESLRQQYLDHLIGSVPEGCLQGLRVVLDTGHGAASELAAPLFEQLGAQVDLLSATPDGLNINRDCGSTVPERTARRVLELGYDLGFAFDGDADRMILCDDRGNVRNGDACLYLWACHLAQRGELPKNCIVVTSMSNLGLERSLEDRGISTQRCDVGDRQVVEALRSNGLRLGGEQSGHLIDLQLATTGDGLLSALQISAILATSSPRAERLSLVERLKDLRNYPQELENIRVTSKPPIEDLEPVQRLSNQIRRELGSDGRLVLRYSGTEPVVRIMVEAATTEQVRDAVERLSRCLQETLG